MRPAFGADSLDLFVPASGLSISAVNDITVMLQAMGQGDAGAADRLLEAVYQELRRVAAAKMGRESGASTLQPTALVYDAWLRLGGDEQGNWQNRAHFFGAAAEAMRRILIDRARRRHRLRHGGDLFRVDVADVDVPAAAADDDTLLAVHEALARLAAESAERAELVKLRYFAGLTLAEAAETLGISERTAKRWWTFARTWLQREIRR